MPPPIFLPGHYGIVVPRGDNPFLEAPELDERRWNALIGVVTAIVGNILISFALNLQRYAHIRIHKQYVELSRARANSHKNCNKTTTYGTQANGRDDGSDLARVASIPEEGPADEHTPLNGFTHSRRSSESTVKPWHEHDEDDDEDSRDHKSYLQSPYWWAGILLMTLGEAGNFLAYGFAPASIVSPLGVVALISNCIIAPVLLKEPFRLRDFAGVLVAVAGAVTVVLSAKSNERRMGPDEIWTAIVRWEFELYLGLTAAAIVGLMLASRKYGHKTILIDLGVVGLCGEYTALSTKGIASLLSDSLWRVITFPITYLLAFILVSTALLQIRYINKALQRFPSTQVIPTQFVIFTLSVIIGSAVLYRDFESATAEQLGKFIGGCTMTFIGVYLITSGRPQHQDDEEDFEEQDRAEEHINLIDTEGAEAEEQTPQRRRSIGFQTPVRTTSGPQQPRRQASDHMQSTPSLLRLPTNSSLATSVSNPSPLGTSGSPIENPWGSAFTENNGSSPQVATLRRHDSTRTASSRVSSRPASPPGGDGSLGRLLPDGGPNTPAASRPSLARKSMSRLAPGPLLTPLSSSLSGIVADSLRKGMDSPGSASARKRHSAVISSLRAAADDPQRVFGEEALASQSSLSGQAPSLDDSPSVKARSKSISEPERAAPTTPSRGGSGPGGRGTRSGSGSGSGNNIVTGVGGDA